MTPFQLQLGPHPGTTEIDLQWFGSSGLHAEDSLTLPRSTKPWAAAPDSFTIDLRPLLAEVGTGLIADEQGLRQADECLLLRELLSDAGLDELCEALYRFLWRQARTCHPAA